MLFIFNYNMKFDKKVWQAENIYIRSVSNLDVSNYEQIFYYGSSNRICSKYLNRSLDKSA